MKKWLLFFTTFVTVMLHAQIKTVVNWDYQLNKISETEYEAVLTADIDDGWHLYSAATPKETGVIATKLTVSSEGATNIGNPKEEGVKVSKFSEVFGGDVVYYANEAKFIQKIKLKNPKKGATVTADILFQVCDDKICLAPSTLSFEKAIAGTTAVTKAAPQKELTSTDSEKTSIENEVASTTDQLTQDVSTATATPETTTPVVEGLKVSSLDYKNPLVDCGTSTVQEHTSNWWIFVLGFVGGLIALLTPCIFPMIPLTVSFFTKGSGNKAKGKRNAFIYGFFILLIFVALSIPFYIIDGISGNIFNSISTNIWLNLFFFAVFLIFALSFFGYFEIVIPSWIANKSAKAEEAGGMIGIFFMALTLVIVSFSCTGPILGSLLGGVASSATNVPVMLTFALAGFGLSWALVFGLLALFPQALQSLPKSGGWMNTVKVVLGFLEVGLALKFLSKADLVSKTFFLKRELFIALWILITLGLVLYVFGIIKFPHDDKHPKIGWGRKIVGILGIGFIVYLIPGLFPSEKPKLAALSGILPPLNVSYYHSHDDGILGMHPESDYFKAIELAKKANKPVLIDFTGFGCENCRKMEEYVWSEPDILPILQNEVILASVYVDDREELPKDEQLSIDMGNGMKKKIVTIGDKWSMFQQVNFNNNSQPHYVLVTPDQRVINTPVSGYMSKEKFKKFLTCGINYYKEHQESLAKE